MILPLPCLNTHAGALTLRARRPGLESARWAFALKHAGTSRGRVLVIAVVSALFMLGESFCCSLEQIAPCRFGGSGLSFER